MIYKAYGIYYTSMPEVLVGFGGRTGWGLNKQRQGPQLPGGTIKSSSDRLPPSWMDTLGGLGREVEEEFGKHAYDILESVLNSNSKTFIKYDGKFEISFVVKQIPQLAADLVVGRVIAGKSTAYDECFQYIESIDIDTVINELHKDNDWFKDGLNILKQRVLGIN